MTAFHVPLIGVKQCPVCGKVGTYDAEQYHAPIGWIHLRAWGVDVIVCSSDCMGVIHKRQMARIDALEQSRKEEPLLPPDVQIKGDGSLVRK